LNGEDGKCQPDSDSFFQILYNGKIPLAKFMRISELARVLQITKPSELLVVNFEPSGKCFENIHCNTVLVARGIFDTACNVGTLERVKVMSKSEVDASELTMKLQELWGRQLTIVFDPRSGKPLPMRMQTKSRGKSN
jgi:hypothetical protein